MDQQPIDNSNPHYNLYLTICSFILSAFGFIAENITKGNVGFVIGCMAGIMSIYAGYLTSKEKRLSIEKMQNKKPRQMQG